MFDPEKQARIRSGEAFTTPSERSNAELDLLDVDELLRLRGEIDKRLPAVALNDMNLEEELVRQYLRVQSLQEDVLSDEGVPANQRAQVASAVASTLQQLVKMQSEFHTAERFKKIENLMVKHMKQLPLETAQAFLDAYEHLE